MIRCDGCSGVYQEPGTGLIISGTFQISRECWEQYTLCCPCYEKIKEIFKQKIAGKKLSELAANLALGRVVIEFTGARRGQELGHQNFATYWDHPSNCLIEARKIFNQQKQGGGKIMVLRFFKDGDTMGIQTDAATEWEFIDGIAGALEQMIDAKKYEGDWKFQLNAWLPQIIDIACAYRGYKTAVQKSVVLTAGNLAPIAFEITPKELDRPRLNGFADKEASF